MTIQRSSLNAKVHLQGQHSQLKQRALPPGVPFACMIEVWRNSQSLTVSHN
jgi:hypothetical protein